MKFSFRKSCIAIIFTLWTKKILSALASMVKAGLSNIRFYMLRRTIWRIGFLEILSFFLRFPISSKSFQKFDENFLAGLSQLQSACPHEDFSQFLKEGNEGIFFSKKLQCYHFQTLKEKDPQCPLQAWLRQACQKIVVHVQTNIFTNRFFLQSLSFFPHFPNSSKKFSMFWQELFEIFDRMVTTKFYMYRSTIWRKIFFFRKIHNFSRHWLECERHICSFSDKTF